ncbi:MAG: ABC transporter permease, partial [Bacteroidota bacterium]
MKVGFRTFVRSKNYVIINLLGLIIGFSSILYIAFHISHELGYDGFHQQADHLYRVNTLIERASGQINYPIIPPAFGPAAKAALSDVEDMARLRYAYNVLMRHETRSFFEDKVFFAEPTFIQMFSFDWMLGHHKRALDELNTVVLTESMAEKYFGKANPLGKIISYNNEIDLTVTGVIKDVPTQSHFSFDFLISFDSFQPGPGSLEPLTSWKWLGFLTYVQLKPTADVAVVREEMTGLFLENNQSPNNLSFNIELQPLKDIYLSSTHLSNPQGGLFKVNKMSNLKNLAAIASLILIVSFFNYFNITSALMQTRTKEMGIRKVFGTDKRKIFLQMGSETFMTVSLALFFSWMILFFLNGYSLLQWEKRSLLTALFLSMVCIVTFSIIGGVTFGVTFSGQHAMNLLKSRWVIRSNKPVSFARVFLMAQFGISASLIFISLIVINQINFFSSKDLGYAKDGVLMVNFRSQEMNEKRQALKNTFIGIPEVKGVSFGPSLDGSTSGGPIRLKEWPEDEAIQTAYFGIDFEFEKSLGIKTLRGRSFSKQFSKDSIEAIMINEKLAEMIGLENPIGKRVAFTNSEYEIIGIFKNFHFKSLHHEIGPLALKIWLGPPRNLMIRYQTQNIGQTLRDFSIAWQEVFTEEAFPFDYRFLDEQLQAMYEKEAEFAKLLKVFTVLAIFLALLGLFGVSSINIQQKIKQIGIRRVLGAEFRQIASLICKRYLITAILGFLFFTPIAYFLMNKWLENYAYRIDLHAIYPIMTLVLVAMITLITLGYQVFRIMTVDPASILRDE